MAVGRACMYVYRKMGKESRFLKKIVMLTGLVAVVSEFFFLGSILILNSVGVRNSLVVRNSLGRKFIYLFCLRNEQFYQQCY